MSSSRAGVTPESWLCVDCGADTAPDAPGLTELRRQVESLGSAEVKFHDKCEIYTLREAVWKRAGAPEGCLCVGCLEQRLGRRLRPKDFPRDEALNWLPGTPRLMRRRRQEVRGAVLTITPEDVGGL